MCYNTSRYSSKATTACWSGLPDKSRDRRSREVIAPSTSPGEMALCRRPLRCRGLRALCRLWSDGVMILKADWASWAEGQWVLAAGHRSAAPWTNSIFGNIGSSGIVKGRRSRQVGGDYGGAFPEDGYIIFLALKKDTDYNNYVKKKRKMKKAKTMTMLSGRCVYSISCFEEGPIL